MGWGSAGATIFIPTIEALIKSNASNEILFDTAVNLINNLQSEDWDTEDESLEHFKDNPTVVRAFASLGIRLHHSTFDRMSDAELGMMRDLYDATTKGVWSVSDLDFHDNRTVFLSEDGSSSTVKGILAGMDLGTPQDSSFIAYSHTFVPKMLDEIERLKSKLRQEYDETEP